VFISDVQLKAVETKLGERVHSQPSIARGPKLKGAWSTFACIGKGHQMNSEVNASRQMYERRIQDLEIDLSNKHYEVLISKHVLECIRLISFSSVVPNSADFLCADLYLDRKT